MLLEYLQSAQEGTVNAESLGELIDTLEEMHGYQQSGKLTVLNGRQLAEVRESIVQYTAAVAECRSARPVQETAVSETDDFDRIREHLILQRDLLFPA